MLRALDLAEAIDSGDITPSTVLAMASEAIGEREKEVGAFAHLDLGKAALTVASRDLSSTALTGLPIGIKDIFETADMPTSYGSKIYEGWKPKADATLVQMIRQAGGVILGKTVTTEFAHLEPPKTRNPHHPERTPGGSSSGSAAGVAAGMLALAVGTQTGGSVIRPAAFNGVAAIKPSFRLLPMVGCKPFAWTLDTAGLFGARVVDVAYGLSAISGRPLRVDGQDFGTPKIGIMRQPYAGTPEPQAEEAMARAIAALEKAGATVVDMVEPEAFAIGHAAHPVVNDYEGAKSLAWEHAAKTEQLSAGLRATLDRGAAYTPEEYDNARRKARQARHAAKEAFASFDAMLSFPAPGPAPGRETTGSATFNRFTTMLGIPCVHVPVLRTPENLPVGVQVLGSFGRDDHALAAGAFLERALAG